MAKLLELPKELQGKFRFTQPIKGGPVFDFPSQSMYNVNLTTISERQAELLIERGWKGLERIEATKQKKEQHDEAAKV
jgi:hypothetical protein